jgi:hypothetical protein
MMRSDMSYITRSFAVAWTVLSLVQGPVYFRYILERGADIFDGSRAAYGFSALYVSILFAVSHLHLGTIVLIPWAGLCFALVYLLSGGNLWAIILMRGLAETSGLVRLLFGLPG